MKRVLLLVVCLSLLLLSACLPSGEKETTATPPSEATPLPTVSISVAPAETPTPTPAPGPDEVSQLSGIPFSEFTGEMNKNYTPVAVMIENSASARPQFGLQQANIVYEAPVESSITRFMAIFNDVLPEKVEPVRSARIYFIKSQQPYDCIFVHYGGPSDPGYQSYIYDEDSAHIKIRVDGIKGTWSDYFVRDKDKSAPHNVITNLKKVAELYDYQPQPVPFRYSYDEQKIYAGDTVKEIALPFLGGGKFVSYKYDANTNLLSRYMDDKPFLSAETGNTLTVQNLIIQHVNLPSVKELSGRRIIDLLGTGDAEFVIDGVYVKGTWQRDSFESPTKFYDESGAEIVLRPGNTWVELHPNSKETQVIR
jgi:hypothetical protein